MKPLKLIALLIIAILISLPSLVFAKGKPPKDNPPGETKAEYTAELTAGDFVFAAGKLTGLTANSKGTSLSGNFRLEMAPEIAFTWDYIFLSDCADLLTDSGVTGFGVLTEDWDISYTRSRRGPDKIHITMNNLIIYPGTSPNYSQVDFDLHLHGVIADNMDFLPESVGSSVSHQLTKYKLWAGAAGQGGFTCNSAGGGWDGWAELQQPNTNTLKITRVTPTAEP